MLFRFWDDYPALFPKIKGMWYNYQLGYSILKVFAGKVRKTGFFPKVGFPQNPFMNNPGQ